MDDARKKSGKGGRTGKVTPPRSAPQPSAGKARLGRGLAALIAERAAEGATPPTSPSADGGVRAAPGATPAGASSGAAAEGRLRELPLSDIAASSRQPRRAFAADELAELAASIRSLGVVQPIVVRPAPDDAEAPWELIAGERRLRAARLAGVETIPALVRPASEAASLEIALAENVAREDLNAIEEALAFAALVDEFGLTHERIGELVGKSRVAVTNVLRLLDLPDEVRELIERGELSEGHGRALLGLADHLERRRVARLVVARGLTVRQTETLVRAAQEVAGGEARPSARPPARGDTAYDDLIEELFGLLEVPVRIRSAKRGGSLELRFRDRDELDRLVALLRSLK
jgi:ParB family chromosome partitioning protein